MREKIRKNFLNGLEESIEGLKNTGIAFKSIALDLYRKDLARIIEEEQISDADIIIFLNIVADESIYYIEPSTLVGMNTADKYRLEVSIN